MDTTRMTVKATFTEPLLGTLPANPEIAKEYILSKHPLKVPAEDEEAALAGGEEEFDKGITIFARNASQRVCLWDYQVKGFFKEACLAMIESGAFTKESLTPVKLQTVYSLKRTIDNMIFVAPRMIVLGLGPDDSGWPGWQDLPMGPKGLRLLQRPLRKENPRGGTVCLATSEAVPMDTTMAFTVNVMNPKLMPYIERWLDYGSLKGMGQWRNASFGRFSWEKAGA